MNFNEAMNALNEGRKVRLPEWGGYWFVQDGEILVMTKDGQILDTPWLKKFRKRTDWMLVQD
jgi:hypothetical protein